jgi:hypoxanthine-guanine phosphoribosyltransferase
MHAERDLRHLTVRASVTSVKERLADGTGAASLQTGGLLRKNVDRIRPIEDDYAGFDTPNEFVVGYRRG